MCNRPGCSYKPDISLTIEYDWGFGVTQQNRPVILKAGRRVSLCDSCFREYRIATQHLCPQLPTTALAAFIKNEIQVNDTNPISTNNEIIYLPTDTQFDFLERVKNFIEGLKIKNGLKVVHVEKPEHSTHILKDGVLDIHVFIMFKDGIGNIYFWGLDNQPHGSAKTIQRNFDYSKQIIERLTKLNLLDS